MIDIKIISTSWTLILAQHLGNILHLHFFYHFITGTALKPEPLGPSAGKLVSFLLSKGWCHVTIPAWCKDHEEYRDSFSVLQHMKSQKTAGFYKGTNNIFSAQKRPLWKKPEHSAKAIMEILLLLEIIAKENFCGNV